MNFFLISELNLFQIEALIPCTITSCPCNKSLEKDEQRCLSFSSGALGDEEQQGKSIECRVKWFFSEEERCMGQTGAISWSSIQAGAGTLLRDQPILVILLHFTVSDEASQGVWAHPHGLLCLCGFHISSQGIAPPLHSSPTMHSWLCRYIHIHIQCTYLYTIAIYRVCTPCVCVCVYSSATDLEPILLSRSQGSSTCQISHKQFTEGALLSLAFCWHRFSRRWDARYGLLSAVGLCCERRERCVSEHG